VEPTPIEAHPCATPSAIEARYLRTILELERSASVRTQAEVARRLGVSAPTALEMIRRLRKLGLVHTEALALTEAGKSAALVLSARRAAAHTLVHDVLGIDAELSRRETDDLATAVSPSLGRRLLAGRGRAQRPAAKP
jgi:Mn-dependent DtxR family transcriptional regulator